MSSISSHNNHYGPTHTDICVGNIGNHTNRHTLLAHFETFGEIVHYNFTSPGSTGYLFITYENPTMVDECMNSRPHYIDSRHLYVKRALPVDPDHPRERFETSRDLMIVYDLNNNNNNEQFLSELRNYFSSYGKIYACRYCHETNFNYILVEFSDIDEVDRVILDKPHYYNEQQLDIMKRLESNIELMNERYSSNEEKKGKSLVIKDAIDDDDDYDFIKSRQDSNRNNLDNNNSRSKQAISEIDLENEVYRLQNVLKKINDDFAVKRKQLEEDCCEQLKHLNESADKTHRLEQDLEQEHAKLLVEHESIKRENEALNEQYLMAELENFEITSYYEQILTEEKAKTAQLEAEYTQKLKLSHTTDCSSPSSPRLNSASPSSTSLLPVVITHED